MADKTVVSGSTVTVGQLKDFFRQIADGGIGFEEMEATLAHRFFEKTLRAVIAACKFDWVNPNVEKHFTLEPVRKERKVFHFDQVVSSEEAERRMKAEEGWEPANLAELLDYVKSEWNGKDWVVALGSSARIGGGRCVPCLCRGGAERVLHLSWWSDGWRGDYRFLAARN